MEADKAQTGQVRPRGGPVRRIGSEGSGRRYGTLPRATATEVAELGLPQGRLQSSLRSTWPLPLRKQRGASNQGLEGLAR